MGIWKVPCALPRVGVLLAQIACPSGGGPERESALPSHLVFAPHSSRSLTFAAHSRASLRRPRFAPKADPLGISAMQRLIWRPHIQETPMDLRKTRMMVSRLRSSDAETLPILTQDVLRRPMSQIDTTTVVDLLALSEIPGQLPLQLARELGKFRDQMFREMADLPDGGPLAEFLKELIRIDVPKIPICLRSHLASLLANRKHEDVQMYAAEFLARFGEADPEVIELPKPKFRPKPTPAAAPAAPAPTTTNAKSRSEAGTGKASGPKEPKAPKTPAAQVDGRREEWIREDVMSRLTQYGATGLKEPVIVAGSRHRSPFSDMGADEVLACLRKMRREGILNNSAGRWMVK